MRFFKILLLFVILFSSNFIYANFIHNQDSIWPNRKIILRLNFVNIMDPYIPAIQVGAEYSIRKRLSLYHELGYINSGLSPDGYFDKEIKGFKFINTLKFYPFEFSKYAKHFVGLDLGLNKYNAKSEIWVDMGPYSMAKPKTTNVSSYYAHLLTGFNIHIKPWYRLCIEYYVGIGIRYRNVKSDIDEEQEFRRSFYDPLRSQNEWMPSFTYGFKIGYLLKKK